MEEMMQTADGDPGRATLETLLRQTIKDLAALNAAAIERSVELLTFEDKGTRVELQLPQSWTEWQRAELQRQILGHLLDATRRQLFFLRQVSTHSDRFSGYGVGCEARVDVDFDRRRRTFSPSTTLLPSAGVPEHVNRSI